MQLTSSQRWAIGAVALAVLIACSPRSPEEPSQPEPNPPTLSSEAVGGDVIPSGSTDMNAQAPGFAGTWATVEAECSEPARTYELSAQRIEMPGDRTCNVASIGEEHPTGRSAIFRIAADCAARGDLERDQVTLNFGAADTIMQLQINNEPPVRLVRCP